MLGSCCGKPIATIIRVGTFDAGIVGLEAALRNVYTSGTTDEEQIKRDLLFWVQEFGNYISPAKESEYKQALMREYRKFVANTDQGTHQQK